MKEGEEAEKNMAKMMKKKKKERGGRKRRRRIKNWDDHLKLKAERWAQKCRYERPGLNQYMFSRQDGHNLFYLEGNIQSWHSISKTIDKAISSWVREKEYFRYGQDCGSACSYVQMVFAKTNKMGCALSSCQYLRAGKYWIRHATLFVCYYTPRGNLVGEYPYLGGAVCSNCPYGTRCDNGGLCAKSVFAEYRAPAAITLETDEVEKTLPTDTSLASLTKDEEDILLEVTNKLRQRKARQQLIWSSEIKEWANYVIRCDREYPGPRSAYTNFGKILSTRGVQNLVYEWGKEGDLSTIKLKYACRTPNDHKKCNHNTNLMEHKITRMACAACNCGFMRQLTCIYDNKM
ncbi:uncharacterized protein LOC121379836 [Gigantopelta aegis]|uniref:uncharacterized protein LOC121379836 n=1 Tax=Gigantopelta aegis TaxID=1735272 RepID=UPI001B88B03A|nr:uncharacterized protein LOC121379836 [Gigantopelta aegis]